MPVLRQTLCCLAPFNLPGGMLVQLDASPGVLHDARPALLSRGGFMSKLCSWHIYSCCLLQGLDVSAAMLDVAQERDVEGDMCLHDLGQGLPLRPGTFDGAISISAVQWLCNAVRAALPMPPAAWLLLVGNNADLLQTCSDLIMKRLLDYQVSCGLLLQDIVCCWQ